MTEQRSRSGALTADSGPSQQGAFGCTTQSDVTSSWWPVSVRQHIMSMSMSHTLLIAKGTQAGGGASRGERRGQEGHVFLVSRQRTAAHRVHVHVSHPERWAGRMQWGRSQGGRKEQAGHGAGVLSACGSRTCPLTRWDHALIVGQGGWSGAEVKISEESRAVAVPGALVTFQGTAVHHAPHSPSDCVVNCTTDEQVPQRQRVHRSPFHALAPYQRLC